MQPLKRGFTEEYISLKGLLKLREAFIFLKTVSTIPYPLFRNLKIFLFCGISDPSLISQYISLDIPRSKYEGIPKIIFLGTPEVGEKRCTKE